MSIPASAPALPSRRASPVALFGGDVPTLLYSDPAKGGDQSVKINPEKLNVKFQWSTGQLNGVVPFNVTTQGVNATLTVTAQENNQAGDVEYSTLMLKSSSSVAIVMQPSIVTPTVTQTLSNVPLSHRLMTGSLPWPGLLPQTLYCLPKSAIQFYMQAQVSTVQVTPVMFGRRFAQCSADYTVRCRRRAEMLRHIHPYWIGPAGPGSSNGSGPTATANYPLNGANIFLPGNSSVTLTFPTKSNADFLMMCMLDDSTNGSIGTIGPPTNLYAQVTENYSGRALVNLPQLAQGANSTALGVSWTDFLAIPSVSVAGFPGDIRAFALQGQNCGWTHWVPRNTQITILFTNTNAGGVYLNPCLFGLCVYAEQTTSDTSAGSQKFRDMVQQGQDYVRWWQGGGA